MLHLDHVSLTLSKNTPLEKAVLQKINLQVSPGEWVMIVGGNGAGKSTLFQLISGEMRPDHGSVVWNGSPIHTFPMKQRCQIVSRVMQDPMAGTIPSFSIFENMAFAARRGQCRPLCPVSTLEQRAFFKQQLSLLEMNLEERLDDPVELLSGGQRQALSLLMALTSPADLLLLDEITAALDPNMAERMIHLTHRLLDHSQKIIFFITHNMHHALSLGSRTVVLSQGKLIADYPAQERAELTSHQLADMLF